MGFLPAEISYQTGWEWVYHDTYSDCKDMPWKVKTASCLPHAGFPNAHALNAGVWSFVSYERTELGYRSKLTLLPLTMSNTKDKHLYDQFQLRGSLSLYVMFNDGVGPKGGYLPLTLKP